MILEIIRIFIVLSSPRIIAQSVLTPWSSESLMKPPLTEKGRLRINISVTVDDFVDVNEQDRTVHSVMTFVFSWHDDRFRIDTDKKKHIPLSVDEKPFWTPNFNIWKSKDIVAFNTSKELSASVIGQNQYRLDFYYEIVLTFWCIMDFENFPFDTQRCPVRILPDPEDWVPGMEFRMDRSPVLDRVITRNYDMQVEMMADNDHKTSVEQGEETNMPGFVIILERNCRNLSNHPARSGMLLTTLLSLVNFWLAQATQRKVGSPRQADRLTALNVWILTQMCFVSLAFVLYMTVLLRRSLAGAAAPLPTGLHFMHRISCFLCPKEDAPKHIHEKKSVRGWIMSEEPLDHVFVAAQFVLYAVFLFGYVLSVTA